MSRLALSFCAALALGAAPLALARPSAAPQDDPKQEKQERPPIYDERADAAADIARALAAAKQDNKRVLVQWGANWCGWCHLLHDLCEQNAELARELLYEYEVVLVDIGKWDKQMDLAQKYGADLKGNGVPERGARAATPPLTYAANPPSPGLRTNG